MQVILEFTMIGFVGVYTILGDLWVGIYLSSSYCFLIDFKFSLTCLCMAVKIFDVTLLLENKIQGLRFSCISRPKTSRPNQIVVNRLWPVPYKFNLFPK